MYRRRHHCRMCGQIFCNPCSSYYIDGSWLSLSGPVRACKFCSEQITDRIEKETKNRKRYIVNNKIYAKQIQDYIFKPLF